MRESSSCHIRCPSRSCIPCFKVRTTLLTVRVTSVSYTHLDVYKRQEPLVHAIFHKLEQLPPIKRFEVNYVPVMPEKDEDKWKFEINVDEDGGYVGEADWLVKVLCMVNLEDEESLGYFQRVLRQSGIIDRLEEMGINEGDTVSILNFEFDYIR